MEFASEFLAGLAERERATSTAKLPYAIAPNPYQKQTNKIAGRTPRTEMALSVPKPKLTIRICLDASSDEWIYCCNADMPPPPYFSS